MTRDEAWKSEDECRVFYDAQDDLCRYWIRLMEDGINDHDPVLLHHAREELVLEIDYLLRQCLDIRLAYRLDLIRRIQAVLKESDKYL